MLYKWSLNREQCIGCIKKIIQFEKLESCYRRLHVSVSYLKFLDNVFTPDHVGLCSMAKLNVKWRTNLLRSNRTRIKEERGDKYVHPRFLILIIKWILEISSLLSHYAKTIIWPPFINEPNDMIWHENEIVVTLILFFRLSLIALWISNIIEGHECP